MKLDRCAACHRSMGAQVSKIKHLKLDQWEDSQVARMKEARLIFKRLHFWNIKGFKNQYVPDDHWSTPIRLETWMQSWNTSNGFLQATEKLTVLRPRLYVLFVFVFVLVCDVDALILLQTLVEQWILAKYGREEFIHPERQSYTSGFMEVSTFIFAPLHRP